MIRASDATAWDYCHRRAWFEHHPPEGLVPTEPSELDKLVEQLGNRHEWNVKRQLEQQHQVIKAESEEHTRALMQAGVAIIYQARLSQDGIIGWPDFLIRHESGAYQPADAKYARNEDKKPIQIQLGIYRKLLNTTLSARVFLGNGEVGEVGAESDKLVDKFLASMKEIIASPTPPEWRYSESKCKPCPYNAICKPQFEAKRDITLIYGVDKRSAPGLEAQGLDTIEKLATADPAAIADAPYVKGYATKQRIVYQAKSMLDGEVRPLKPLQLPTGTWVHFDIEANPLTESGAEHVYLWGFLKPPYDHSGYDLIWTDSDQQDREGWDAFIATVEAYRREFPNLILAHYHRYEVDKIKLYAERYQMQEHPTVAWLLGDESPLFDMYKMVLDCIVLPVSSYSLKVVCKHPKLVNFQWDDADSGSQWSIVQYVNYLMTLIPADRERIKRDIITYNFDDVKATRKLEEWLRSLSSRPQDVV